MKIKNYFTILLFLLSFSLWAQVGSKAALVIIDMQPYFAERGGNDKDAGNAKKINAILAEQERMIKLAREKNMPIVFIEYVWPGMDMGVTHPRLTDAAKGYSNTTTIPKSSDGMFDDPKSKEKLDKFFAEKGVGQLFITGANGGACVEQSIRGALNNNYSVTSLSNGVADFNYQDFIYPYKGHYSFNPTCQSCSFKEVDGVEDVEKDLEENPSKVNNASRASGKEAGPEEKAQQPSASGARGE